MAKKKPAVSIDSYNQQQKDAALEEYQKALSLYQMGEIYAAIGLLDNTIKSWAFSPHIGKIYQKLITWHLEVNNKEKAKILATYFIQNFPDDAHTKNILRMFDDSSIESSSNLIEIEKQNEFYLEENSLTKKKISQFKNELLFLEEEKQKEDIQDDEAKQQELEKKRIVLLKDIKHFFLEELSPQEIEHFLQDVNDTFFYGYLFLRKAYDNFSSNNLEYALDYALKAKALLPAIFQDEALDIKKRAEFLTSEASPSISFILPLTGDFKVFGSKVLKAIALALGKDIEPIESNIFLFTHEGLSFLVADSKSDPSYTEKIVEELAFKYKTSIIIGDIIPQVSNAISKKCNLLGIPHLSLSRRELGSENNKFSFMFNVSFEQQISHLVTQTIKENKNRFAILFPESNYGKGLARLFYDKVLENGGVFTAIQSYPPEETTFNTTIKRLVGMDNPKLREDFHECLTENLPEDQKLTKEVEQITKMCSSNLKPVIDFDYLFIPEFRKTLFIIPALVHADILLSNNPKRIETYQAVTNTKEPTQVTLLGTNAWNNPEFTSKLSSQVDGSLFLDVVNFNANKNWQQFYQAFLSKNVGVPSDMEAFAHDATLLAAQLLRSSSLNKDTRNHLTEKFKDYKGKAGLFENIQFDENLRLVPNFYSFTVENGKVTNPTTPKHNTSL